MYNKQLLERINELFQQKLQVKTGWGRNEVLALLKDSQIEALSELVDKQ